MLTPILIVAAIAVAILVVPVLVEWLEGIGERLSDFFDPFDDGGYQ